MNPEWKARWMNALRSGEYKQSTGHLRNDYGFCCLGVLCDIFDNQRWIRDNSQGVYEYQGSISGLSADIKHEVGLWYEPEGKLIDLNDLERRSFHEIAKWIEEHL